MTFDFYAAAQLPIYVSPTGSDGAGTGSFSNPFASVSHALDLLNQCPSWLAQVRIIHAAGTYVLADSTNWQIKVSPGLRPDGFFGSVSIEGDVSGTLATLSSAAGTTVAGTFVQQEYPLAHGLTITDGSHFLALATAVGASGLFNGRPVRASPTTSIVTINSTTAPLTGARLLPWATIYQVAPGKVLRVAAPLLAGGTFASIAAIQFDSSPVVPGGVYFRCCRTPGNLTATDSQFGDCTSMGGLVTMAGTGLANRQYQRCLHVSGSLYGGRGQTNIAHCVIAGTYADTGGAKLYGGTSGAGAYGGVETVLNLVGPCDFEGAGHGVRMAGGRILSNDNQTGAASFANITGAAMLLLDGAVASGPGAGAPGPGFLWKGTAQQPSEIRYGARLHGNGMFQVTNSVTPGADVTVGAAGTIAAGAGPLSDPAEPAYYA